MQKIKKLNTILYDFDGVLAESNQIKTEAFHEMYYAYGEEIVNKVIEHHKLNNGISRFEKIKLYHSKYLNIELDENQYQKELNRFSSLVLDKTIKAKSVNGSVEFLNQYSKFYNYYVITATPTLEIIEILKKRNIISYFKQVFGSPENKDFWVKHLIKSNKITNSSSVFIGDAQADYNAAYNNNIEFILRKTNENYFLQRKLKVPMINDFYELPKLLNRMFIC